MCKILQLAPQNTQFHIAEAISLEMKEEKKEKLKCCFIANVAEKMSNEEMNVNVMIGMCFKLFQYTEKNEQLFWMISFFSAISLFNYILFMKL